MRADAYRVRMTDLITDAPPRAIAEDITDLVGATPLLRLKNYSRTRGLTTALLGKVEAFNPLGSVKDRIAWAIIRDAEERGALRRGDTIVDVTSGNTGIALAALAASRGYRTKFYLGDNTSPDKRRILEALGAELVPIDNSIFLDPDAREDLFRRVEEDNVGSFIANQLENPANPRAHYETTGPEIWRDSEGAVDVLVVGVGTGGTASGAGRFLKEQNPGIRVIVAEPGEATLPTEENLTPREIDGVHKVAGVEDDLLPGNYDATVVDEVIEVEADDAYATALALLREDGVFVGQSAGAIVAVATRVAQRPEYADKTIVAVLPDTGERYLSAGVFDTP